MENKYVKEDEEVNVVEERMKYKELIDAGIIAIYDDGTSDIFMMGSGTTPTEEESLQAQARIQEYLDLRAEYLKSRGIEYENRTAENLEGFQEYYSEYCKIKYPQVEP